MLNSLSQIFNPFSFDKWEMLLPDSNSHLLVKAIIFLLALMGVLLLYMLISLGFKNKNTALRKRYLDITDTVIQNAIFSDEYNRDVKLPGGLSKLLANSYFRNLLIEELVKAKRNFSGDAAVNIVTLYRKCNLDKDSQKKLKNRKWNVKAQAIQELAEMGIKEYFDQIFALTNNKNEQIRIEAQNAVVMFSGFKGLSFLDFLSYPLSDWQQIKLLNELGEAREDSTNYIRNWLSSPNYSVIIFSLKLVAKHHHFELHSKVIHCLSHPDHEVRNHAICTLKDIYNQFTAPRLVEIYPEQKFKNKLAILEVLQFIGSEKELSFLMEEFRHENHQIKLAAGRAIVQITNIETLEGSNFAEVYPWTVIINQIKGELTE